MNRWLIFFYLLLASCQEEHKFYSGYFSDVVNNAERMRGWDIVLNGYLAVDEFSDDPSTALFYDEKDKALANGGWNEGGFLVRSYDKDISSCIGKYVTLIGEISNHDRGRISLSVTDLKTEGDGKTVSCLKDR